MRLRRAAPSLFLAALAACAADAEPSGPGGDDLPLGDLSADDLKDDSSWGAALTCKPVPDLPALPHPEITVSLNGLTLHLVDRTTGFDKVFPIGVGAIDTKATSATFGESLSYWPLQAYDKQDFQITPSSIQPCKTWWTDPATGQRLPVFAGLPFLSWSGNYAIHGPIDNYRAPNGGTLRRGYVSHGCVRMEAADVLELYARIKGVARVPVHVQREPERSPDDDRVDVPQPWIGAECDLDEDCPFTGGFCKLNRFSGRGFCTARCTRSCADRNGYPTTFCVDDPDDASLGICVAKEQKEDLGCRPFDHFVPATRKRHTQPSVSAKVCVPGSPGWVGDRCFVDGDCRHGTRCGGAGGGEPGICTMSCDRYCADEPGWPDTFCIAEPSLGSGGSCVRTCTPDSFASECPADHDCVARSRRNDSSTVRDVCLPR